MVPCSAISHSSVSSSAASLVSFLVQLLPSDLYFVAMPFCFLLTDVSRFGFVELLHETVGRRAGVNLFSFEFCPETSARWLIHRRLPNCGRRVGRRSAECSCEDLMRKILT